MPPEQVLRLALVGLYSFVIVALFVAMPVLAWRGRPLPKGTLVRGAVFAVLVLGLQLPGIVVHALYYDPRALFDGDVPAPFVEHVTDDVVYVMLAASVGSALVLAVWRILVWAAATVVREPAPFPWLDDRMPRPWGSAIALGVGLGLLGVAIDLAAGSSPELTHQAPELFPGLPAAGVLPVLLAITGGVAAALAEELLFRGVLQRLLLRWLPPVAAIAVAAVVVACGQALEPHLPWMAIVRAGIFAAALGTMAHRHGLECSFLAHTVLALVVAAGTLVA